MSCTEAKEWKDVEPVSQVWTRRDLCYPILHERREANVDRALSTSRYAQLNGYFLTIGLELAKENANESFARVIAAPLTQSRLKIRRIDHAT